MAVQPGAGWGWRGAGNQGHRGCCTGGRIRQSSFLVTLIATSLPPQLSPFTAIGSFASGCGKCGQDGQSWRPLCIRDSCLGNGMGSKEGAEVSLGRACFLLPESKPCCVWLCVPLLTAIVTCSTGLSGFWVEPVQGFSSLVWRSGMGEPQAVVVGQDVGACSIHY